MSDAAVLPFASPKRPVTHGEHACEFPGCGVACGYGIGWPPRTPMRWFCAAHAPEDFLPPESRRA